MSSKIKLNQVVAERFNEIGLPKEFADQKTAVQCFFERNYIMVVWHQGERVQVDLWDPRIKTKRKKGNT